ncbi:phospholipase D-like domain-containing protein [Chlamydiifrater phoenicopteri]|uniref:phospholipase D-like domain-containing protein n=1 Tax=Chlamydiifrater phoenicopteri TaxID=2681469 RepID=UPI001BCB1E66|nr:phospholipase D-like domain-containing protein [Chlamydiifrater phoenicopteri]
MKNKKRKPLTKLFLSAILLIGGSGFLLENSDDLKTLEKSSDPVIYSSQCKDNVRGVLCNSMRKAKNSIFVRIYNLSDEWIINTLHQKSSEKVPVKLHYYHLKNEQNFSRFYPNIETIPAPSTSQRNSLMHIKATVVDDSTVWVGSANYTSDSLDLDSNLTIGIRSQDLSNLVTTNTSGTCFVNNKQIDYFAFPEDSERGLNRILKLINNAKYSIKVGMFALTEPHLLNALYEAHSRGVDTQIIIDKSYAPLTKQTLIEECRCEEDFPIWIKTSKYKLHHKFAWIDDSILISGSANWSRNGFHNNVENILILHDLTPQQNKKMLNIWNQLLAKKTPLEEYLKTAKPISRGSYKKGAKKTKLNNPLLTPSLTFLETYYSEMAA